MESTGFDMLGIPAGSSMSPCREVFDWHFNMARQVVFEDGQLWIVRLRMPGLKDGPLDRDVKRKMFSEVASMRFLRLVFCYR